MPLRSVDLGKLSKISHRLSKKPQKLKEIYLTALNRAHFFQELSPIDPARQLLKSG
jgi:hypothetical protein